MPHPALDAVKKAFDKAEQEYIDKMARGHVDDWGGYQRLVGKVEEVRAGRLRAMEEVKRMLEAGE